MNDETNSDDIDPDIYSTDDPVQVTKRQKRAARIEQQYLDDMRTLMGDARFRRWLWRVLGRCRLYEISYTGTQMTNFYEGMRNVGLGLLADVQKAGMEDYLKMIHEAKDVDK